MIFINTPFGARTTNNLPLCKQPSCQVSNVNSTCHEPMNCRRGHKQNSTNTPRMIRHYLSSIVSQRKTKNSCGRSGTIASRTSQKQIQTTKLKKKTKTQNVRHELLFNLSFMRKSIRSSACDRVLDLSNATTQQVSPVSKRDLLTIDFHKLPPSNRFVCIRCGRYCDTKQFLHFQ
jgi:hypothetical protein